MARQTKNVIFIFPIYGQIVAIRKPDSGRIVCKTYIFINSNLVPYKSLKYNEKILNTAVTLLLWVKVLVLPKNTDISKIKEALVLKSIFSETTNVCVLTYQVSSFYCNSNEFWIEGGGRVLLPPPTYPTSKQTPKSQT